MRGVELTAAEARMLSENDRYVQLTSHQSADSGPGITNPEYPSRARSGEKPWQRRV